MRTIYPILLCVALAACNRPEPAGSTAAAPTPAAAPAAAATSTGLKELSANEFGSPQASATCNLEMIGSTLVPDAKPIAINGRKFTVSGWAFDDATKKPPSKLFLRLISKGAETRMWEYELAQNIDRTDVQNLYGGASELVKTGFSGEVDAAGLPAGEYSAIVAYLRDSTLVVCDNGRAVVLN